MQMVGFLWRLVKVRADGALDRSCTSKQPPQKHDNIPAYLSKQLPQNMTTSLYTCPNSHPKTWQYPYIPVQTATPKTWQYPCIPVCKVETAVARPNSHPKMRHQWQHPAIWALVSLISKLSVYLCIHISLDTHCLLFDHSCFNTHQVTTLVNPYSDV